MPSIPRSAALAAASAATGAVLFGVAAGGVASVDGELRAASAPPTATFRTVEYGPDDTLARDAARPAWDCPGREARATHWDET